MSTNSDSCKPRCVADALGLGTLADGDDGVDVENLRLLYRHARNEDGQRELFTGDATFKRGWVNLDAAKARELVSAFIPLDDADNLKAARHMAQSNLEAQPWNDVLGINSPPIRCRIKVHGSKWGLRFQSAEPTLRGKEMVNEELPPISVTPTTAPEVTTAGASTLTQPAQSVSPTATSKPSVPPASPQAQPNVAADVLRKGGLPA